MNLKEMRPLKHDLFLINLRVNLINMNMNELKISMRRAISLDLEELHILYNSDKNLFGEDNTGYDPEDILEYISDPQKKMFVACHSNQILAALLAEYHETYVYLDTFIVHKDFQRKGIGKQLMTYFEDDVKANHIPLIESLTEIHNYRMQHFFENNHYSKGNQFIFYSKRI
jgi:ribosomal protein S18 acetylase RimI-like enzyme